jgi:hypothetical protein
MLVSDEDTGSESQQQSVRQLVTVVGPHEPRRLGETEVRLSYSLSYHISVIN